MVARAEKTKILCGHTKLPNHEVFDAEARAALLGLQAALKDPKPNTPQIYISAWTTWKQYSNSKASPGDQANQSLGFFKKLPGHGQTTPEHPAYSQAGHQAGSPEGALATLAQFWSDKAPKRYKDLGIGLEKRPLELLLPRAALGRLLAARSVHGDFAEYHECFKHEDAPLTCSCSRRKEPSHFYYCREGRKAAAHPWGQQPVADILTTKGGFTAYADWLEKSQFYTAICRRH
ncbi:hypothetical protein SI65_10327 [Aspergillus cristatus]|uniref:RNase H type-1 domain-containing protein n=1 Tax=Aspergillus cristatus TaxID=573508 RepID=A0A1E3AZZ8_ASPCR|nr:hypothetical protein SI65_10327 [Aspergillus cristatus]